MPRLPSKKLAVVRRPGTVVKLDEREERCSANEGDVADGFEPKYLRGRTRSSACRCCAAFDVAAFTNLIPVAQQRSGQGFVDPHLAKRRLPAAGWVNRRAVDHGMMARTDQDHRADITPLDPGIGLRRRGPGIDIAGMGDQQAQQGQGQKQGQLK